jgi:hypothetical protein
MKSYDFVKRIVESWEDENMLNDFLETFEVGKDISYEDYITFNMKYVDGSCDEEFFINYNWNNEDGEF